MAIVVAMGVALSSAPAAASPPDLTSSAWTNPASPTSPPWNLQASPDLGTLTGTWTGDAKSGHGALMGSSHGDAQRQPDGYVGTFHVTELVVVVNGTISFTIVTPDELTVTVQGRASRRARSC